MGSTTLFNAVDSGLMIFRRESDIWKLGQRQRRQMQVNASTLCNTAETTDLTDLLVLQEHEEN